MYVTWVWACNFNIWGWELSFNVESVYLGICNDIQMLQKQLLRCVHRNKGLNWGILQNIFNMYSHNFFKLCAQSEFVCVLIGTDT